MDHMAGGAYWTDNTALSDEELSDNEDDLEQYMEGGSYTLSGGN